MYVGRLIWNRLRYSKDPDTGKRVSKLNPPNLWIVKNLPELRIIDDQLWDKVKARQKATRASVDTGAKSGARPERARRPAYLFSGLLRCGVCGGGFTMVNMVQYACNNARSKGTCSNKTGIRRDRLEELILEGLKSKLMKPTLVKEFVAEFQRETNRLSGQLNAERDRQVGELRQVDRDIRSIIDSIKAGFRTEAMRDELESLEARKKVLTAALASSETTPVRFHPNLADIYRGKVEQLHSALNHPDFRAEATGIIREMIEEIRLVPENGELRVHLLGQLAALFALAQNKKPGFSKEAGLQVTMVAGAGFEPTTFRL
jgi:site-specific DNA recombinase